MLSIFIATFLIICSISLFSQNEDGVRNDSIFTVGPPFSAFHTHIPIIRSIPPLSLSMPIDVLFGYIALDSLSKFYNDSIFIAIRGHNLSTAFMKLEPSNDTLHSIWKYLYKMMDYNPIIFRQYLNELCISQNGNIKYNFFYDVGVLLAKSHYIEHPLKKRIASAMIPDYILKVQVVRIDSMKAPIASYGDTSKYKYYNISCIVLDTIKGKVIPMDTINISENLKKQEEKSSISYRFNFVISTNSYSQPRRGYSNTPHPFPKVDSLIFDKSLEIMRVEQGQELLVFLQCTNPLWSKTQDHFQIYTIPFTSNSGVMPIIDGMVSDVNKVWSDSTWIPYSSWKEKYNEVVDMIMNKKY